jgi:hypothetical protein
MSGYTFVNFASSTIAGGAGGIGMQLGAADVSLIVGTGDGTKFGSPSSSYPEFVMLGTYSGSHELCKVTAVSSDTLTIVRAQESTSAAIWPVGTAVVLVVTKGQISSAVFGQDSTGHVALAPTATGTVLTATAFDNASTPVQAVLASVPASTINVLRGGVSGDTIGRAALMVRSDGYGYLRLSDGTTEKGNLYGTSASGMKTDYSLFIVGSIKGLNNLTTAGSYGVPPIMASANNTSIVNTTDTVIATFTTPNDGVNHLIRCSAYAGVGAGNTNNATLTLRATFTGPKNGSSTLYFLQEPGVTQYNAASVAKGADAVALPLVFAAQPNTAVNIRYINAAAGTISDIVSGVIEMLT